MTDEGTPMGPGFFIFFQQESGGVGKGGKVKFYEQAKADDDEVVEIIQFIHGFLDDA